MEFGGGYGGGCGCGVAGVKVAMVSEHASPLADVGGTDSGGQNVHVAALSQALAQLGADVTVHTRRDDPALPATVAFGRGVTVSHVDAGPPEPLPKDALLAHMPQFTSELARAWAADAPDVVHSHFWMSGAAALAAAEPMGIPVAHTFHALGVVKRRHQGAEDTSPPERPATEAAVTAGAARILATCSDEVRELLALGAFPGRLTVIPCGVDLTLFWPEGRREDPPEKGRARILVVGRLVARKGVDDVLQILPQLPGVELVVAGGPHRSGLEASGEARRLREHAERLGVSDRVDLRGRVERVDLPPLLRSADLVVCAPWYEPFGIVPLEAMACGVPVVASAVGGLLDTVVDKVTGVHVPPRRPDLLAVAIAELLADPARRERMGAAASRRARLYSWRRVAAATLRVYDELVRETSLRQVVAR